MNKKRELSDQVVAFTNKISLILSLIIPFIFFLIANEENGYLQLSYLSLLLSVGYSCQFVVLKRQQVMLTKKQKTLFYLSVIAIALSVPFISFTYFVKYKSTCIGGNGNKCYALAREEGRKARGSAGVLFGNSHEEEAAHYLELACRNDVYDACVDLIKEFESKLDAERIRDAYRFAAKYNKADLFHLAKFELRQKNNEVAEKVAKESCEVVKDEQGCMLLGGLMINKGEELKGIEILKASCNSRSIEACGLLYTHYKEKGASEESTLYLKHLCTLGNSKACEMLENNVTSHQ